MKALILGSLGALCDTSDLWDAACRKAFRDHGLTFHARGGRPALHRARSRPGDRDPVPVSSVLRARNDHFSKALARTSLTPRARMFDLLDEAERQGVKLGLVVTRPMDWTVLVLEGLGIAPERFDAIVTARHVTAPKPAPDCYHLAAAMLATAPEDCLVVENGRSGMAAAKAAGMKAIDLADEKDFVAPLLAALPRAPALHA